METGVEEVEEEEEVALMIGEGEDAVVLEEGECSLYWVWVFLFEIFFFITGLPPRSQICDFHHFAI